MGAGCLERSGHSTGCLEADGPKEVVLTATAESGAQVESAGGVNNIAGAEGLTGGNWDPQVTSKGTGGEVSWAAVERHAVCREF